MNRYVVGGILVASAIGIMPVLPWWAWLAVACVAVFLLWRRVRRPQPEGEDEAAE